SGEDAWRAMVASSTSGWLIGVATSDTKISIERSWWALTPRHWVDATPGQHGRSVADRWIDQLFVDPPFALFRLSPRVLEPPLPTLGEYGTECAQIECVGVVRLAIAA